MAAGTSETFRGIDLLTVCIEYDAADMAAAFYRDILELRPAM
jgi:hypothetical protein